MATFPLTTGNDTLTGTAGNDIFTGPAGGIDVLNGRGGNDIFEIASGTPGGSIEGGLGTDTVRLTYTNVGLGSLTLSGVEVLEIVYSSSFHSVTASQLNAFTTITTDLPGAPIYLSLVGSGGSVDFGSLVASGFSVRVDATTATAAATLTGTIASDWFWGSAFADTLYGGNGADHLTGGAGDDDLDGGSGNDTLAGGYGSDTYHFGIGSGDDTVDNFSNVSLDVPGKSDRIVLDAGLTASDVTLKRINGNLVLTIAGTGDRMIITNNFVSADYALQRIEFADGTVWDQAAIQAQVTQGSPDADYLVGADGPDAISGLDGNDTISGGGGNDTIDGGLGDDSIGGGSGDDQLTGGEGNDRLYSGTGNDTLWGGEGHDILVADDGQNELYGGNGNDYLYLAYGASGNKLDGEDGDDTIAGIFYYPIQAGVPATIIDGGIGTDKLTAMGYLDACNIYGVESLEVDRIVYITAAQLNAFTTVNPMGGTLRLTGAGNIGSNFTLQTSNIVIFGSTGADRIDMSAQSALCILNTGDDTGGNVLIGGSAGDTLGRGTGTGDNTFDGGLGSDTVGYGASTGPVTINLATGTATSTAGHDTLISIERVYGSNFADRITGSAVDNVLNGGAGAGNDTLSGGGGNDSLAGGGGDDLLSGGVGNDTIDGGDAIDTATYAGATAGVDVSLAIAGAQNTVGAGTDTLVAIENLIGSAHGDWLFGNAGANRLTGGLGDDFLAGYQGNDTLIGGDGNDTFVFDVALDVRNNVDRITDFSSAAPGNDDTIRLSSAVFTALAPGALAADAFVSAPGAHATAAFAQIVYDETTGSLFYDSDGIGGHAQVRFAILAGHPSLACSDFIIV